MSDAAALKAQGNTAFSAKKYDEAVDLFGKAIEQDPDNHVLYSNRSASYAGLRNWAKALEDADKTIEKNPSWPKGYARRGAALHGARQYDDAVGAYQKGLDLAPDDAMLKRGLEEVKRDQTASESGPGGDGIGAMFSDPNMVAKLASNPKTAPLLADPAFVNKLKALQANPQLGSDALQDPRMIQVLGALMGVDMQAFERPEGSNEMPPGFNAPSESSSTPPPPPAAEKVASPPPPQQPQAPEVEMKEPEAEPEEEDESKKAKKAKKEAQEEKLKGNEAYKKRQFDEAIKHYEKAWEVDPTDISYLTNLAAVYFEQGDHDKCIETCEKAIEEGRNIRADFKLIAKAFGRIGTAYMKKGDLENAIKYFNKSLTEHRTPDILGKLRDAEKKKSEAEKQAYINPELAEKEREEGNKAFKAGDFATAVKHYTEAIKRDPSDPRSYNNRASAYTKLAALPEALKDVEKAIELDPKFVKAYIRKATVLFGMREYTKAMSALQQAEDADTERKHTREIQEWMQKVSQALYKEREGETDEQTLQRAMRDPEVAQIMQDPVMQQILQQAQSDPRALQDHMKNPVVREKIQKLLSAGIIRTK